MSLRIDLVRPDDLLSLQVECENLRLDAQDPSAPALIVDDPALPAFLIVQLPPQTIAEQAFFETSTLAPPPKQPPPGVQPTQPPDPPLAAPVSLPASARMGGPSRLVLRVPPDARIPYTTEGLLGWGGWELSVAPAAAIPPDPSPEQLRDPPAIRAPGRLETAIELPYRLVLSPGADAAWDHHARPRSARGRTELWHTRLARAQEGGPAPVSRELPAPLRAIWSPDYVDRPESSGAWPKLGQPDPGWGALAAMTPRDRHEIVILTSGFQGFQDADGDTYVPRPVLADQLFLSALGGWLRSRGGWDPPYERLPLFLVDRPPTWERYTRIFRGANLRRIGVDLAGPPAPPPAPLAAQQATPQAQIQAGVAAAAVARLRPGLLSRFGEHLNISEWAHNATQGRDHFVKIVYEGTLYESEHRAALVKITERKVRDVDGRPMAALFQRMFIVVRQPRKEYPPAKLQHGGRGMPLRSITLTTLVTPDIDPPQILPGTEYSFWVSVGGQPFPFHGVTEDIEGASANFSKALIFVPNADEDAIPAVRSNHLKAPAPMRAAAVPGQQISYAPRAGSENTTFATRALYFDTHPAPGELYLPRLLRADVQIPAVEQILGTDAPATIAYWQGYLEENVPNPSGTFAVIAKEVVKDGLAAVEQATIAAPFSADKAGGIATPDLSVSSLSRALGPLAGDVAKGAADDFDPTDFFKDVKDAAKLFGTIPLVDLLQGGSTATGAPKVRLSTEPVDGRPLARRLVATLDWRPAIQPVDLTLVRFLPGPATELVIAGRIERVVEVPPPPSPAPRSAASLAA